MGNNRRDRKLSVLVRTVTEVARLSTCKRLRVGCAVVIPELTEILSFGYNGPPAGMPNDSCRHDQPGNCGCVHAEANAIIKIRPDRRDLVLITTHSPCEACAGLIVNSGRFGRVIHVGDYRLTAGTELLIERGVTLDRPPPFVRTAVIGERANAPKDPLLDTMTSDGWAKITPNLPAFRSDSSREKLSRIGIDLGTAVAFNLQPPTPAGESWDVVDANVIASFVDLRPFDVVYLASRKVAAAFDLPNRVEYGTLAGKRGYTHLVVVPHPSGLNRFWNDPAEVDKLRKVVVDTQEGIS